LKATKEGDQYKPPIIKIMHNLWQSYRPIFFFREDNFAPLSRICLFCIQCKGRICGLDLRCSGSDYMNTCSEVSTL
jgi:hypothetical protein